MKKITQWLGIAILVFAFAYPMASFAQNVNGNLNVQVGNQGGGPAHRRVRMGFPAIRRSLMMLKRTRNILQHGRSVFGGHRAQAIQAVDQAIAQCKAALEYARNHKK